LNFKKSNISMTNFFSYFSKLSLAVTFTENLEVITFLSQHRYFFSQN